MSGKQYKTIGEDVWKNRTEKVNAELFTMTYGALVVQLIKDYEDYQEVNKQLDKMGYNIGTRLIEDFLARTNLPACQDFKDAGEVISKIGFKTFLNITPTITYHNRSSGTTNTLATNNESADTSATNPATGDATAKGGQEYSLILEENPLADFVELPDDAKSGGLWFSNVLPGVLRGCLEMVQIQTECFFVSDVLRGDESTELRVRLIRYLEEEAPIADD